jgi:uncharacterized repeat protein (TIGR01451 family)
MRISAQLIIAACLLLGYVAQVQAVYINRTITMDGVMSDWYDTDANTYLPAGDITNNTGQYSDDAESGSTSPLERDGSLTSTGRDLRKFSFTYDHTNLYFYVERWASSTNITDWWFYMDTTTGGVAGTEPDGLMQSGEKLLRVSWQGNTGSTVAELYDYVESASGGDPLVGYSALAPAGDYGDGYTMPGDKTNVVSLYNTNYGSSSGTEMETILAWASLGLSGPANIKFHISSSNGQNIPNNIIDNMDGPAGGQLFPKDLQVSKTASVANIKGNQPFSYTVTVYNAAIIEFTNVVISDVLPAQVTYVSHTAEAGTTFDDSDSNSIPDEWNIPGIPTNTTYTLTINVTAGVVPVVMNVNNTATLTVSNPADEESSNDSANATVSIEPIPVLTMVKYSSSPTVNPGGTITYTLDVTNTGGDDAYTVVVEDQLSPFVMFGLNTYGAGAPFQLVEGSPASGLTIGTTAYSNDSGATYTYTPTSGGGGAPAGFDANVTNWKIEMTGTMTNTGGNFDLNYQVMIR